MPERLHFQGLLVAALVNRRAAGLREAAVDHPKIVVTDGSVFVRAGANFAALSGAATAEIIEAEGGIEPGARRPIEGVANHKTLLVAVANQWKKESGFANAFTGRGRRVGQPDQGNAEKSEVRIDQCDVVLDGDSGFRGVKLPGGLLGIADGDPGMFDDVDLFGEAIDLLGFEVKRIAGDEEAGIGAALDL